MNYVNYFSVAGVASRDYSIILTEPPKETFPQREVEFISIPGRSGNLTIDKGRFENVTVTYKCAIVSPFTTPEGKAQDMRTALEKFIGFLKQTTGYRRQADSYHPDTYRVGLLVSAVDVESIVEQAGIFSLPFLCKPQRYLLAGDTAVSMTAAGTVVNNTLFPSKPLITVYGTGPGNLSISGVTVQILALSDQITLDCEAMNAYRKVGDAAAGNKNGSISAMTFPELLPGNNPISWTGGISRIEITPRWWTL